MPVLHCTGIYFGREDAYMNCKFCNAEMEDSHKFCPFCGKAQVEELAVEETVQEQVTAEEAIAAQAPVQEVEVPENVEQVVMEKSVEPSRKNPWPLVLGITGAVLGLAALAVASEVAKG